MSVLRSPAQLAAAVAAWHNLNPLARRVTADQVHALGVVELPLAAPAPGGRGGARLLCRTDALYHAAPKRLAAWLQRHGGEPLPSLPADLPRRRLDEDEALADDAKRQGLVLKRLAIVLSAAVDVDGKRLRVLVSLGPRPAICGSRALSLPRFALASGGAAALAAAAAVLALVPLAPSSSPVGLSAPGAVTAASAPRSAASAALASSAASTPVRVASATGHKPPPPALAGPVEAGQVSSTEPAPKPAARTASHAQAGSSAASAGLPARAAAPTPDPQAARALQEAAARAAAQAAVLAKAPWPPRIRPSLDADTRQAALNHGRALRAQAAADTPEGRAVQALATGKAWAIVTRPAKSRDAALAQMALLRGLVAQTRTDVPTRLELMPAGKQWRVAWWPHVSKEAAAGHLAQASARGLKVELVAF